MNLKVLILGILIGAVVIGASWWVVNTRSNTKELFAKKEHCTSYTQKRQAEADEKRQLLGHSISVEGFYSPIANTCMTHSLEIAVGHYMQLTLIDELTLRVEASAFEATGQDFVDLPQDAKIEQVEQDKDYHDKLRYFRGQD